VLRAVANSSGCKLIDCHKNDILTVFTANNLVSSEWLRMTPTSSLQWAELQNAFAAGDAFATGAAGGDSPARCSAKLFASHSQPTAAVADDPATAGVADRLVSQGAIIAALLRNIERFNQGERGEVEQQLAQAVPMLAQIGLFELFSPGEWVRGENAGRRLVGLFAQQYLAGPQK
jgi:hypothetical protein